MVECISAQLDAVFSALGDATRREILAQLAEGEAKVGDLAAPHEMSLQAVSKHLAVLEGAGLIHRHKEGRVVRCRLEPETLAEASAWIAETRAFWEQQFDALADYLDETQSNQKKDTE